MKNRKRYQIIDFMIIAFISLGIFVFILLPFLFVFIKSFFPYGVFSFSVYEGIFENDLYLLRNSLKLGFFTTVLTTLVSICVAIFYYMASPKLKRLIFAVLSLTIISPPFVTSLSYINLFGRRGLITYHLLGLSTFPYGIMGIVLMQTLSDFSLSSLLLIGILENMDRFSLDSARSLGAKTANLIKDIILPNMLSGIKAVVLLSFLRSIADFGTPAIIGGSFNVLATESYFAVIAEGNLARAAGINVMILLPALAVFSVYQSFFQRMSLSGHGMSSSHIELERKGLLYRVISFIAVFFLVWVSVQYGSILLSSVTAMKKGKLIFTLNNIFETLPYINKTVLRSITYSLISAIGGSVLGLLIGYYTKVRKLRIMKIVDFAATLPYIIPGTFFGLGYLLAFSKPPILITGTSLIVVLNVLFKQMPFSTKVGNASMEDISEDTLNSIRDLGGTRVDEIKDAVIPLGKNALGISFVNAFTATMTTVGSIIFLVYPGQKVLTLVMFDVIQSGKYNVGSVIAVIIISICLFVNTIYLKILKGR